MNRRAHITPTPALTKMRSKKSIQDQDVSRFKPRSGDRIQPTA